MWHSRHYPSRSWYSIKRPRRDARLSWPSWLVTHRDGIPARRWSPIQCVRRLVKTVGPAKTVEPIEMQVGLWTRRGPDKWPLASTPPRMPGTHPPQYFGWGDVNGNIPQYYYVLSDIAEQYWLPSVRSASSRFHSAIRRHEFASVPAHTIRWFVPPTLNSRWRHCEWLYIGWWRHNLWSRHDRHFMSITRYNLWS